MIVIKGKTLYRACIVNCRIIAVVLDVRRTITVYAHKVPGGRIVDFSERNEGNAMYRVRVKLKHA